MNESVQLFLESFWPIVWGGISGTIPLALASFAIGLVLALAVALMRLSKNPVVSNIARFYISVIRGTPLLVTEPIRGQEEFNADYMVTAGVGVQARLTDSVPYMVESLMTDAPRLARMRQNALLHGKPKAALDVADIVLNAINSAQ